MNRAGKLHADEEARFLLSSLLHALYSHTQAGTNQQSCFSNLSAALGKADSLLADKERHLLQRLAGKLAPAAPVPGNAHNRVATAAKLLPKLVLVLQASGEAEASFSLFRVFHPLPCSLRLSAGRRTVHALTVSHRHRMPKRGLGSRVPAAGKETGKGPGGLPNAAPRAAALGGRLLGLHEGAVEVCAGALLLPAWQKRLSSQHVLSS